MITSGYGRSASDTPHLGRQQLSCSSTRPARRRRIDAVPVPANGHTPSPHTRCAQVPTPINFDDPVTLAIPAT